MWHAYNFFPVWLPCSKCLYLFFLLHFSEHYRFAELVRGCAQTYRSLSRHKVSHCPPGISVSWQVNSVCNTPIHTFLTSRLTFTQQLAKCVEVTVLAIASHSSSLFSSSFESPHNYFCHLSCGGPSATQWKHCWIVWKRLLLTPFLSDYHILPLSQQAFHLAFKCVHSIEILHKDVRWHDVQ